jgi:hypothetical protein
MNVIMQYERTKASFVYLGKRYSGEVVCNETDIKTYWFIFDQLNVKPFGGSIEFKMVHGYLEPVKDFGAFPLFILCIKKAIDEHRKQLCN